MMITKTSNTIVFLLLTCFFVTSLLAQQKSGVYNWQLKPGMPEWKELTTHDQMLEVLKVPIETLEKMTTKDLVQTCLNYPLYLDMLAFNNLQDGIERVIAGFNGLQELLKRDDAGKEIVKIYKEMDPHNFIKNWSDLQKGIYIVEFAKIEILMAQETIISSLTQYERKILLKESLKKQNKMQKYLMYDMNSQEPNAFLMGKILEKDYTEQINQFSKQKPNLQFFLKHGSMAKKSTIDEIVQLAKKFANN